KIPAERTWRANPVAPVSVVRLPLVYGPGDPDDRVGKYVRLMRAGASEICLHESVAEWKNARAYVANVGAAVAKVATTGEPGGTYNVADSDDLSEQEWIERIAQVTGWRGRITRVPDGDPAGTVPVDEIPFTANFRQHLRLDTSRLRTELGYR